SLDSVITAVGMARHISVMVIAMVVAVGVMLIFAGKIGDFVNRHPSMKILALSFLILIGVLLVAEAFEQAIPKGYIYFSMAFAFIVEMLNLRLRTKSRAKEPVQLHQPYR
ncbi:MAG TPA: TerC family protein, partial [Candidatus Synoicihabitans sp.]|nr:TerC family protein [Candidatus Synoicihabitans sp.]